MKKTTFLFILGFCFTTFVSVAIAKESTKDKLEAISKLTKTISTIEKYYVDDINFTKIVEKSISGLLSNLDAHSSYLNEKDFKDLEVQTKGEFGGLGISVGMKDGALTIIAPIEGTPADKAKLKSGDIILRIDGNSTIGTTLDEAVNKMRGKEKTPITITILRENSVKPFDVNLTREIIKVESAYAKMVENENILYLRVANFDKNVDKDISKFIKQNKNATGIILDLRNNPGGLLDQAVALTNLFVDEGIIVSQKGKESSENQVFYADKKKKITNLPMVVLVNGGSASASEIVSGSLQDHKRAVIVGENTFGKGSVQVVLPLSKNEAVKLTIARYYLPSGRTIQSVGVKPDLEVFSAKVPIRNNEFSIKEKDLKQHLENELEKIEVKKTKKSKDKSKNIISQDIINNDLQLKTAIDTIKILRIKERK